MPGEALVDKGIIRIEEVQDAGVFAHDRLEKKFRLLPHRLAQWLIKFSEFLAVWVHQTQIAQLQPLAGEVVGERRSAFVGEQPLDLCVEDSRSAQLAGFGKSKQFVIRH